MPYSQVRGHHGPGASHTMTIKLPTTDAQQVASLASDGQAAWDLATKLAVETADEQLSDDIVSRQFTFNDHSVAMFTVGPDKPPYLFNISISVDFEQGQPYLPMLTDRAVLNDDGTFTTVRTADK